MKKINTILGAIIFTTLITTSFRGKTTEQCKDDIGAYEFGREMQFWTKLRGEGSLSKAINKYSSGLGINSPYNASNDCVKRGYSDAQENKKFPIKIK